MQQKYRCCRNLGLPTNKETMLIQKTHTDYADHVFNCSTQKFSENYEILKFYIYFIDD